MLPTATAVINGAFNAGLLEAMKNAGITKKMWLSQRDGKVRDKIVGEDHVDADGQVVEIFDKFIVKSRRGTDSMDYPSDSKGSPENVINCRCTILGVT